MVACSCKLGIGLPLLPVVTGSPICRASAATVLTAGGKDGEGCADSSGGAAAVADLLGNDCAVAEEV